MSKELDKVIGQDRPLKILRGLLSDMKRFPSILVIDGPHGVGKTMTIDILNKFLIENNIKCEVIETRNYEDIPSETKSRACRLHFNKINPKDALGFLLSECTKNNTQYSVEGLNRIVRKSQGDLRKAISYMNTVSTLGKITKDLVLETIENNEDEISYKVFTYAAQDDFKECLEIIGDYEESEIIDNMFSFYGKCFYDNDDTVPKEDLRIRETIKSTYRDVIKVTDVFLKWHNKGKVPIQLFLYELSKCAIKTKKVETINPTILADVSPRDQTPRESTEDDISKRFKGRIKVIGDYQ